MVPFRAIENGISIFRTTSQGFSMAIDPYRRVIGMMDQKLGDRGVFAVQMPAHRIFTVYGIVGDNLGWLVVVGIAALVLLTVVRGKQKI